MLSLALCICDDDVWNIVLSFSLYVMMMLCLQKAKQLQDCMLL